MSPSLIEPLEPRTLMSAFAPSAIVGRTLSGEMPGDAGLAWSITAEKNGQFFDATNESFGYYRYKRTGRNTAFLTIPSEGKVNLTFTSASGGSCSAAGLGSGTFSFVRQVPDLECNLGLIQGQAQDGTISPGPTVVNVDISNVGTKVAQGSVVCTLSIEQLEEVSSPQATLIGTVTLKIKRLEPFSKQESLSMQLTIPNKEGIYYIIAAVNTTGTIAESNLTNNARQGQFQVL